MVWMHVQEACKLTPQGSWRYWQRTCTIRTNRYKVTPAAPRFVLTVVFVLAPVLLVPTRTLKFARAFALTLTYTRTRKTTPSHNFRLTLSRFTCDDDYDGDGGGDGDTMCLPI